MIAIIGATGNVGRKIVEILLERGVDSNEMTLFASAKSHGKFLKIQDYSFPIYDTATCEFDKQDIVVFATDSDISRKYAPIAIEKGCYVVDTSSAYRLDHKVPLIIPPVNLDLVTEKQSLYAMLNCVSSPLSIVLKPLHDMFKVLRVVVSTYQSSSGAGKDPMDELFAQSQEVLTGKKAESSAYFPRPLAFNVVPQVDKILNDGFTNEEFKIIKEIQKVISHDIKVMVTSVRVPVGVGHSASVNIDFAKPVTVQGIKDALKNNPNIVISENHYHTPAEIVGKNQVFVGRIRKDPTEDHGIGMWIVSDNLRRGAALDAVEVIERLKTFLSAVSQ